MSENDALEFVNKYINECNKELSILNDKLDSNNISLLSKQNDLNNLCLSFDGNGDIFIPEALRDSTKDQINSLKYEIDLLNKNSSDIKEQICNVKVRIDELNIIMDSLKGVRVNDINNDLLDIVNLCIKLIDVDVNRVKQELFHVKHLLED